MLHKFKRWRIAKKFNKKLNIVKYILLIPSSVEFKLIDDLNEIFKRNYKQFQYEEFFRKMNCIIVYFTVLTKQEKKKIGPIANDIDLKICIPLLKNEIKEKLLTDVRIVAPVYLKHKVNYNIITYEQFILNMK